MKKKEKIREEKILKELRNKLYRETLKYKENSTNEREFLKAFGEYATKYCSEALKKLEGN